MAKSKLDRVTGVILREMSAELVESETAKRYSEIEKIELEAGAQLQLAGLPGSWAELRAKRKQAVDAGVEPAWLALRGMEMARALLRPRAPHRADLRGCDAEIFRVRLMPDFDYRAKQQRGLNTGRAVESSERQGWQKQARLLIERGRGLSDSRIAALIEDDHTLNPRGRSGETIRKEVAKVRKLV